MRVNDEVKYIVTSRRNAKLSHTLDPFVFRLPLYKIFLVKLLVKFNSKIFLTEAQKLLSLLTSNLYEITNI